MTEIGEPGMDFLAWFEQAHSEGLTACCVPVTVDGEPGLAHGAFTDCGGQHDRYARSEIGGHRAAVGIIDCSHVYAAARELGADG